MKNYSRRELALLVLVLLLAGALIVITVNVVQGVKAVVDIFGPAAPVAAATVATLSLGWSAYSTWGGWRRNRRQATLEAWDHWSDSTFEARHLLSTHLGHKAIGGEQAKAFIHDNLVLEGIKGPLVSPERPLVGNAMVKVLNGLERLAVGIEQGIFDSNTLVALGGTSIVRTYERFEQYIHARRTTDDLELRQARAYVALEKYVREINLKRLDSDRLNQLR